MKNIFCIIVLTLLVFTSAFAKPEYSKQWQEATEAYSAGNYSRAVELYSAMSVGEYGNSEVYYNMGNCYFKMDKMALAILNYNRALVLDPGNSDIKHNLKIAEMQTTNRIEKMPQFFVKRWTVAFRDSVSSNRWAVLSIVFVALTLISFSFFYFSRRSWLRKTTFSACAVLIVLFIGSLSFSISQRNSALHSTAAVVMKSAVAVKSSPTNGGKDLFVLNEGAVVTVKEKLGDWSEVVIESGNSGWLESVAIEYINPTNK